MKTINWWAARAATPASATCRHCERSNIVVDRITGLLADHYTTPKTNPGKRGKRQGVKCAGGGQLYTSTPAGAS